MLGGLLALVVLGALMIGFFALRSHALSEARRKEADALRELRGSVRDAERAMDNFLGR